MALGSNLKKISKDQPTKEGEQTKSEMPESIEKNQPLIDLTPENLESDEADQNLRFEQFCVFKAGGEEYAIPINLVREVVPYPEVSSIPQMPRYIKGMSNVRGNIFGVMDLNMFFGGNNDNADQEVKYLLVIDHEIFQMGIEIPEVPDTLMASEQMIEKLSSARLKSKIGQKYLKGIIKKDRRMIILFDILGIISSDKFTATV